MGLLGTLFGGTLGFMLGGPLGALLGGALGSRMGDGETVAGGGARRVHGARVDPFHDPRAAQAAFMVALISLAAKVAKADGTVSAEEVRAFDAFLRDDMGMPPADRRYASRIFNQARDSAVPASAYARQIRQLLGGQPDRLRDLVSLLYRIAMADDELHRDEERLIASVARDMGLTERDLAEARAAAGGRGRSAGASVDTAGAYAVLGVAPDADEREIKKAYRRLARDYHPDVIVSKGLPEDFMTFAKEKLQTVNEAYERIRKERGF